LGRKLDNISIRNDERVDFDEDTLFALVSPLNFVAGIKTATYVNFLENGTTVK
jgi:hypothetical protein